MLLSWMLVPNAKQVKDVVMYGIPRPCTKGTTLKVYWISTAGKVGEDDPCVGEG